MISGEGPVVHVHPTQLDFGRIQVLKDASRKLCLSNQSAIPALFEAQMVSTQCFHHKQNVGGAGGMSMEASLKTLSGWEASACE